MPKPKSKPLYASVNPTMRPQMGLAMNYGELTPPLDIEMPEEKIEAQQPADSVPEAVTPPDPQAERIARAREILERSREANLASDRQRIGQSERIGSLLANLQSSANKMGSVGGQVADSSAFTQQMKDMAATGRADLAADEAGLKQSRLDEEKRIAGARQALKDKYDIEEMRSKSIKRGQETAIAKESTDPNSERSIRMRRDAMKVFPRVAAAGGIGPDMTAAEIEGLKAQFTALENNANDGELRKEIKKMELAAVAEEKRAGRSEAGVEKEKDREFKKDLANITSGNKKPNEGEKMAAYYASRLKNANKALDAIEASGFQPQSLGGAVQRIMPNVGKSSSAQQQEQAERDFVNSILRRESGAAISPAEFESAEKQYFPRFGDSPEVLKQKKLNRQLVAQSLESSAGNAPIVSVGGGQESFDDVFNKRMNKSTGMK